MRPKWTAWGVWLEPAAWALNLWPFARAPRPSRAQRLRRRSSWPNHLLAGFGPSKFTAGGALIAASLATVKFAFGL